MDVPYTRITNTFPFQHAFSILLLCRMEAFSSAEKLFGVFAVADYFMDGWWRWELEQTPRSKQKTHHCRCFCFLLLHYIMSAYCQTLYMYICAQWNIHLYTTLNYINWAYIKLHEYGRAKLEFSLQKKFVNLWWFLMRIKKFQNKMLCNRWIWDCLGCKKWFV